MTTFAILASGESMSAEIAAAVRGKFPVVVVSDAFRLALWADGLAAQDPAWWNLHREAKYFRGRKFSVNRIKGVERIPPDGLIQTGSSSGIVALQGAKMMGMTKGLLFGFDMQGTHFFGKHPAPLINTTAKRFDEFKVQFDWWGKANPTIKILNCTSGSALKCFEFSTLEAQLNARNVPDQGRAAVPA